MCFAENLNGLAYDSHSDQFKIGVELNLGQWTTGSFDACKWIILARSLKFFLKFFFSTTKLVCITFYRCRYRCACPPTVRKWILLFQSISYFAAEHFLRRAHLCNSSQWDNILYHWKLSTCDRCRKKRFLQFFCFAFLGEFGFIDPISNIKTIIPILGF